MRALPALASTEKDRRHASVTYVLRVDFPAPVGTLYYSDKGLGTGDGLTMANAAGGVRSWGDLSRIQELGQGSITDIGIDLMDAAKTTLGHMRTVKLQHVRAYLYLYFDELVVAQAFIIASGELQEPVKWDRKEATFHFDVTDLAHFYDRKIGIVTDKTTFANVVAADEQKILPLVYGHKHAVQLVHVKGSARCTLVHLMRISDMVFYVDDSREFPQNVPITVIVGTEYIDGSFNGNTFTVTQRGAPVVNSNTTAPGVGHKMYDNTLGYSDNQCIYQWVKLTTPDGVTQESRINYYNSANGEIRLDQCFLNFGAIYNVPNAYNYWIVTHKARHPVGTPVILRIGSHIYVANMVPSVAVDRVYGIGTVGDTQVTVQIDIDPTLYTLNRNDPQFGFSHNTTTITFIRNVLEYYETLQDEVLYCDIRGADINKDGTGALIENPALVIDDILETHLGVAAANIDAPSFNNAFGLLIYNVACAITEMRYGVELAADLAFQARCTLLWEDDVVRLIYLDNTLPAVVATVAESHDYDADSTTIGQVPANEVISEIVSSYENLITQQKSVRVVDAAVEALYGRHVLELDIWAYERRTWVECVTIFWLTRMKYAYEIVQLQGFLSIVELQRQDVVELSDVEFWLANQKATVLEVTHAPGSGEGHDIDTFGLMLRLPRFAGCEGPCETVCEETSQVDCDLVCQTDDEIDCAACEIGCQGLCQLTCTTADMMGCTVGDINGNGGTESTTTTAAPPTTTTTSHIHTTTSTTTSHIHTTTLAPTSTTLMPTSTTLAATTTLAGTTTTTHIHTTTTTHIHTTTTSHVHTTSTTSHIHTTTTSHIHTTTTTFHGEEGKWYCIYWENFCFSDCSGAVIDSGYYCGTWAPGFSGCKGPIGYNAACVTPENPNGEIWVFSTVVGGPWDTWAECIVDCP